MFWSFLALVYSPVFIILLYALLEFVNERQAGLAWQPIILLTEPIRVLKSNEPVLCLSKFKEVVSWQEPRGVDRGWALRRAYFDVFADEILSVIPGPTRLVAGTDEQLWYKFDGKFIYCKNSIQLSVRIPCCGLWGVPWHFAELVVVIQ